MLPSCAEVDDRVPLVATSPAQGPGAGSEGDEVTPRDEGEATGSEEGESTDEGETPEGLGLDREEAASPETEEPGPTLLVPLSSVRLGGVGIGETTTHAIEIANLGVESTAVRAEVWSGEELGLSVDTGCDVTLGPGDSCELGVSFTATSPGERRGTVLVSTPRDETATFDVIAEGVTPGSLVVSETAFFFEGLEAGVGTARHRFVLRNDGVAPASSLQIALPAETSGLSVEHDCPGVLGGGAACNLDATFAPKVVGALDAFITVAAGDARLFLSMYGRGLSRVTVTVSGEGQVSAEGLSCEGGVCSGLYYPTVPLRASARNGSGWFFSGWEGPAAQACRLRRICDFPVQSATHALEATFEPTEHNIIFLSRRDAPSNLGGLPAYDARCNALATDAGINDANGAAYVAAMSDGATSLRERLGSARGWITLLHPARPLMATTVAPRARRRNGSSTRE